MSVDWLTVVAQIVNFLVLVWLLHRFLYGPIVRAMERREASIKTKLAEAAETKHLAEVEAEELKAARQDVENRRERMLSEAKAEAERLRHSLEEEVRGEMEALRETWRKDIEAERETFVADLKRRMIEHFYTLSREALGSLANTSLNDAIADGFADRFSRLDAQSLETLRSASRQTSGAIRIESTFPLEPSLKRRITVAVHELLSDKLAVEYAQNDDLICGIRLKAGGQTVSWSIASYVDRLEARVRAELDEADGTPSPSTTR